MTLSMVRKSSKSPGEKYRSFLDWFAKWGSGLIIVTGSIVIIGWLLHIRIFMTLLPGLVAMKANTASCFIAAGICLWALRAPAPDPRIVWLARCLAAGIAIVGGLSFAENALDLDFGIDQFILLDNWQNVATPHPGRMASVAGLNFVLMGVALLCLKARRPPLAACAQWVVAPGLFISLLAIVGYAYGIELPDQTKHHDLMALHTILVFFVLALSIVAMDSAHGFAHIAASDTAGGLVARRLIPAIPLVLILLGGPGLTGERAGLYNFSFGLALNVVLSITIGVIAIFATAVTLHRIDLRRLHIEAEFVSLNLDLERRVAERTNQLDEANRALEQLSLQDGLTLLANRRSFDAYLDKQVAIGHRHKRILALILCDIDCFKAYNDNYGHQAGDDCLKQVAMAIRSCCRRPADVASRYGGEEFAITLPETELAGAALIAEAVRDAVAKLKIPHAFSSVSPFVSISGGFAVTVLGTETTARHLIADADGKLYRAKKLGRNRMIGIAPKPDDETPPNADAFEKTAVDMI